MWCYCHQMIISFLFCLFQLNRKTACWAITEGGWREEASPGPNRPAERQRKGSRERGERQGKAVQQRLLPRTRPKTTKARQRQLERWNIKIVNSLESCLKTVICDGWLNTEGSWKEPHCERFWCMRQIVRLLLSLSKYFCTPREERLQQHRGQRSGSAAAPSARCSSLLMITSAGQMVAITGGMSPGRPRRKHSVNNW